MPDDVQKEQPLASIKRDLLTPDQRRERYFKNLSRLETLAPESFYPPEMKRHQWEEVPESPELEAFMKNFSIYDKNDNGRFDKRYMKVFRDIDTKKIYAIPAFLQKNATQIILDMLITSAKLAPWSNCSGLKCLEVDQFFKKNPLDHFDYHKNWIIVYPLIIENLVNGLGDDKYSNAQRINFLNHYISAFVHETVHQYNDQEGLSFGGFKKVLLEISSTITEYLVFPGKNEKMTKIINNAIKLLGKNEERDIDDYEEATLIGMLISAQENSFLPENDDKQGLTEGLHKWRAFIEGLTRPELETERRKLEGKYFISKQDKKLFPAVIKLKQKYPDSLKHLQLISWEYLPEE